MRRTGLAILWAGLVCPLAVAQGSQGTTEQRSKTADPSLEQRLEALQREVDALKAQKQKDGARAVGRGGITSPEAVSEEYVRAARSIGLPQEGVTSRENERVKIGGRLDFEFYDSNANGGNLGLYTDTGSGAGRQFGMNSGATEFRIHRLELMLDLEMIEDFIFHATLSLDPVVAENDEGAVDIDEAYARFGNVVRNIFGFEDPSHSFVMAGNYYRWERDFLNRFSESFSLAGTSFYRDEVTGIQVGGDFEWGLFYRVSIDNGTLLSVRDAAVGRGRGAIGNSPVFHDQETLGDLNNSKDIAIGAGFKNRVDEPKVQYGLAVSYRSGRLSGPERGFLTGISSTYNNTSSKRRLGFMFTGEWDLDVVTLGGNTELWFASDGNADRKIFSFGPYVKLPLDGVYYQKRLFFTGVGAGYRFSTMHLDGGFTNATRGVAQTTILDDMDMHTAAVWLDVTRNVDLRLEVNTVDFSNSRTGTDTEWLLQWGVRF